MGGPGGLCVYCNTDLCIDDAVARFASDRQRESLKVSEVHTCERLKSFEWM